MKNNDDFVLMLMKVLGINDENVVSFKLEASAGALMRVEVVYKLGLPDGLKDKLRATTLEAVLRTAVANYELRPVLAWHNVF